MQRITIRRNCCINAAANYRKEGTEVMARKRRQAERRISIRAVRRDPPDLKKLSQALIALAIAQAEAEAQAEHEGPKAARKKPRPRRSA